ncbi:MAG: M16 family metallopeptidase [Bacteroidota bacterium]
MRHLLSLALTLLIAIPAVGQERLSVNYQQFELDNGLTVVLHQDRSAPVLATSIWYHVGSANERPGRTGFAHLFEHIMFEGSANVPEGKIDEWFEEVGGSPNGSTNSDRTNYLQQFSSNALDLALFIESDRMAYLLEAMTPETVDGQRGVVQNERRQSYENRPYGLAWETLGEALYPEGHPYHWPVIGYMADLEAASYEDVVHFFETYYVPNNTTLSIAGDLDYDEARTLVEKWFSEIPRGEEARPLEASTPPLTGETRLLLEDQVQLPRLYMAWLTPPSFAPGDAEMTLLGELLTRGKNSRLYQRLVYDLQIADDVAAFQSSSLLSSEFMLYATARSGHTLDELQLAIDREIERLKFEPASDREVQRILNGYETAFYERLESVLTRADLMAAYEFYTGNPDYFEEDLARFRALDGGDLSAAARRFLPLDRRVVLSIVPEGSTDLAAAGSLPVDKR